MQWGTFLAQFVVEGMRARKFFREYCTVIFYSGRGCSRERAEDRLQAACL